MEYVEAGKITSVMGLFKKHSYLIIFFCPVDLPKSMSFVVLNKGVKCKTVKMKFLKKNPR